MPARRAGSAALSSVALVGLALLGTHCAHFNRADPLERGFELRNEPSQRAAKATLRVATYNVHGEPAAAVARALRAHPNVREADVIFLEEIESHADEGESRASQVARELGASYAYAPGYGLEGGGSHGVAILSYLPLREVGVIELPRYHVVVNSARRVALAARIDLQGMPVQLYAVHLDNRINPGDREEQLGPVLDHAALSPHVPAVVAGDMNTSPFCWIGHVVPIPCGIQDNRLEAYVRARGFDTPVIESGATSKWIGMRLDAIYTRGMDTGDFGVDDTDRISDHLPLWADLQLGG